MLKPPLSARLIGSLLPNRLRFASRVRYLNSYSDPLFGCLTFFLQQCHVAVLKCHMLKDQANLLRPDLEHLLHDCKDIAGKSSFLLVLKRFLSHVEYFEHWHVLFSFLLVARERSLRVQWFCTSFRRAAT